ncbi:MAG: hypothetical protein K6T75_02235 [Acetobacteraceae bacterium]|nr:hypothetical protein [Acetobacteraceae bacterium]
MEASGEARRHPQARRPAAGETGWRAVARALEGRPGGRARGEFWVGRDLLFALGLDDTPAGLVRAWLEAGMDLGCFPVADAPGPAGPATGSAAGPGKAEARERGRPRAPTYLHRRFSPAELRSGLAGARAPLGMERLFLFVGLDGPLGRWSLKLGPLQALERLAAQPQQAARELEEEASRASELLREARRALPGLRGVLLCDDLAYQRSSFLSPASLSLLLLPLYRRLAQECRALGLWAVLHSDGNFSPLLPALRQAGFCGVNCDPECLDPFLLRAQAPEWALFTGVPSSWLLSSVAPEDVAAGAGLPRCGGVRPDAGAAADPSPVPDQEGAAGVARAFVALSATGGAVLSSACGVADLASWRRLLRVYREVEGA